MMKASRELDDLIAEKVMGLTITAEYQLCHYSTSIEDAWEVVEKFAATDGHHSPAITSAFLGGEGKQSKGWCVSLGGVHSVYGETAPHAICLAALKTVGIEF